MLSNPPFGVDWKKIETTSTTSTNSKVLMVALAPAYPRLRRLVAVSAAPDQQNARCKSGGGRIGIILNGSPLFTGGQEAVKARSAATFWKRICWKDHRPAHRHVLQHRYRYLCVDLSNKKAPERKGKVQLIDGSNCAARCVNRWGQNVIFSGRRNWFNHPHVWRFRTRCHHYACALGLEKAPEQKSSRGRQPATPKPRRQKLLPAKSSTAPTLVSSHHR